MCGMVYCMPVKGTSYKVENLTLTHFPLAVVSSKPSTTVTTRLSRFSCVYSPHTCSSIAPDALVLFSRLGEGEFLKVSLKSYNNYCTWFETIRMGLTHDRFPFQLFSFASKIPRRCWNPMGRLFLFPKPCFWGLLFLVSNARQQTLPGSPSIDTQ